MCPSALCMGKYSCDGNDLRSESHIRDATALWPSPLFPLLFSKVGLGWVLAAIHAPDTQHLCPVSMA